MADLGEILWLTGIKKFDEATANTLTKHRYQHMHNIKMTHRTTLRSLLTVSPIKPGREWSNEIVDLFVKAIGMTEIYEKGAERWE